MSRSTVALVGILLALGAGGAGYWYGHSTGEALQKARQDADLVKQLGTTLNAHSRLIDGANQASAKLRRALSDRAGLDEKFSKEFRDALKATAGDRDGCRFSDGIVQQLGAARDRAAKAATSGITATVPSAGPGSEQ